jgi:threonine dehydratase
MTAPAAPRVSAWPISFDDVRAAEARIRPHVAPSPAYQHPLLDEAVGHAIRVTVKHENFNPTHSFKVRNGLSFMSALPPEARERGVVAATRGNHGLGLAYAGRLFGVRTTLCVPVGNNPDKNAGMRALGARVVEEGRDYDESLLVAERVVAEEGATVAHSTNDRRILAGAATLSRELLEQAPDLEAIVMVIGGGSQVVGAMTVARALRPGLPVYGVQAAGAAAAHDSWHARREIRYDSCNTIADGVATRSTYELTFPALLEGLADFITVTDAEIAAAMRLAMRTTHTMVEPAGAAGLAGLVALAERLAGKHVGVVFSGANVDGEMMRKVLVGEI